MTWLILGVLLVVALAVWLTWTAMRIDRLNARVAAAWLSLDAALVRRSAALRAIVDETPSIADDASLEGIRAVVSTAHESDRSIRAGVENTISAAIADLDLDQVREADANALRAGCVRVRVARTFYNDGVRAARALRAQRVPRWSGLARRLTDDEFFDIDDSAGTIDAHR